MIYVVGGECIIPVEDSSLGVLGLFPVAGSRGVVAFLVEVDVVVAVAGRTLEVGS